MLFDDDNDEDEDNDEEEEVDYVAPADPWVLDPSVGIDTRFDVFQKIGMEIVEVKSANELHVVCLSSGNEVLFNQGGNCLVEYNNVVKVDCN
jgi:hypothetical protein